MQKIRMIQTPHLINKILYWQSINSRRSNNKNSIKNKCQLQMIEWFCCGLASLSIIRPLRAKSGKRRCHRSIRLGTRIILTRGSRQLVGNSVQQLQPIRISSCQIWKWLLFRLFNEHLKQPILSLRVIQILKISKW